MNVLFNQAKTGYVSGISYELDGFVITGSKLGNAYKWTTLKATLDYNNERDELVVKNINERSKQRAEISPPNNPSPKKTTHRKDGRVYKRATNSQKYKSTTLQELFPTLNKPGPLETLLHAEPGKIESVATEDYYLDHQGIRRKKRKRGRSI